MYRGLSCSRTEPIVFFPAIHATNFFKFVLLGQRHFIESVFYLAHYPISRQTGQVLELQMEIPRLSGDTHFWGVKLAQRGYVDKERLSLKNPWPFATFHRDGHARSVANGL